ncbi:hypothetical protein GF377_07510 [candidate division GN15 bacterium]|nr:hypothetical protein [candidate division GN15 bacterium]
MAPTPLLKIDTPTGTVTPGRGFYQLEDDLLYVQIGEYSDARRFFNYLESDSVRLDIDRHGRLMLIEVSVSRRQWQVQEGLTASGIGERADIHWLDFREAIPDPVLLTNERRTELLIRFLPSDSWRWYVIADSVLVQTDEHDHLTAIMITDIEDDLAGQAIGAYRKQVCRPKDDDHIEQ